MTDKSIGVFIRGMSKKLACVNYLGGNCAKCHSDLTTEPWLAEFHHRNPKEKSFQISKVISSKMALKHIKNELDKCDLLCHRCHVSMHFRTNLWVEHEETIRENATMKLFDDLDITDEQALKVIEMAENGSSIQQITAETGISRHNVRTIIPVNSSLKFGNDRMRKATDVQIISLMDKGLSTREIAEETGLSYKTAWKRIAKIKNPKFNTLAL